MIRRLLEGTATLACTITLLACGAAADPADDALLGDPEEVAQVQSALGTPESYVPNNNIVRDWKPGSYAYQTPLGSPCSYLTTLRGLSLVNGGLAGFFTVPCSDSITLGDILADGTSRIFFTDTNLNRIFRYDNVGAPSVYLTTPSPPNGTLQADTTYLYWSDGEGIHRKRKDGTGINALLASGNYTLLGIDGAELYVGSRLTSPYRVYRMSKTGGALTEVGICTLGCSSDPVPCFTNFTFDSTHLYWMSNRFSTRHLFRMPKSGGACYNFASTTTKFLAGPVSDGANLYWAENSSSNESTLTGTNLKRATVGTWTPVTEHANLPHIRAMHRNGSYLYWQQANADVANPRVVKRATAP